MQQSMFYQFEIHIHRIYVDINFPCDLKVRWKKGKHQLESKSFKIKESINFIDINDFIGIRVKCKMENNSFLPLETKAQVLLYPHYSNEIKVAGQIEKFDLSQMILVERRKENTQKKFELPLAKSTLNSRIVFTIYAKYSANQNQESLADISFQAQSNSPFNQSATDMTFRPQGENKRPSKQKEDQNEEIRSPLMPPRADMRPQNREVRTYSRQNRYDTGRQNRDSTRFENAKGEREKQQRHQHPFSRVDMPLGFSFGPQAGMHDKEKQMRELLDNFNEVNRELTDKKRECERLQAALRAADSERGGIDQKKLQLINQLNSAITQVDSLKRQKVELNGQFSKYKDEIKELQWSLSKLKEENKDLVSNFNRLRDQSSQQMLQLTQKLQQKRKEADQLRHRAERVQKLAKQNQQLKNDLFRKQSQLISSENHAEEIKAQYLNKSIPIIEELKRVNQDLGRQKAELERSFGEVSNQLNKEKGLREEIQKRENLMIQDLEKEKQKIKSLVVAFETKQMTNKQNLSAIQQQMQHFFSQKNQQLKEKDHQISEITKKLTEQLKGRQQEHKKTELIDREFEASQIQISELKVKIKHLQEAYGNLQRDYGEKEKEISQKSEFIQKVREYVTKIESENMEKEGAIKERDEFIAKAKEFITARQKELVSEIEKLKKEMGGVGRGEADRLKTELSNLVAQGSKRQGFVAELVEEGNLLQRRLQEADDHRESAERRASELQQYSGHLQERLEIMQQEMEELVRKTRSQEQTLQELVKNKLQMEIQLNLCKFQLQSVRNRY